MSSEEKEDDEETAATGGGDLLLLNDALNRRISIPFETKNDNNGEEKILKYYPGIITDYKLSSNHKFPISLSKLLGAFLPCVLFSRFFSVVLL